MKIPVFASHQIPSCKIKLVGGRQTILIFIFFKTVNVWNSFDNINIWRDFDIWVIKDTNSLLISNPYMSFFIDNYWVVFLDAALIIILWQICKTKLLLFYSNDEIRFNICIGYGISHWHSTSERLNEIVVCIMAEGCIYSVVLQELAKLSVIQFSRV